MRQNAPPKINPLQMPGTVFTFAVDTSINIQLERSIANTI